MFFILLFSSATRTSILVEGPVTNIVKTNALKKRVVVLIWKIIFFPISLFTKPVTYVLIPLAIYIYENCQ